MVFFNHATRQMTAKIVYYGPGLCGKTTNLNTIYGKTSQKARGEMVSLNTETDRTLFFDLLPMDVGVIGGFKTKLQLYTVPGQVFYNSTRKLVLKGVDGIVFVADSQVPMLDANRESLQNLEANLRELGMNIQDIPMVFQWNKRDLKNVVPIDELEHELNPRGRNSFQSNAREGTGVFETLRGITKLALTHIKAHHFGETSPGREEPPPREPAPRTVRPAPPRPLSLSDLPSASEVLKDATTPVMPVPRKVPSPLAKPAVRAAASPSPRPSVSPMLVSLAPPSVPKLKGPTPRPAVGPKPLDLGQPSASPGLLRLELPTGLDGTDLEVAVQVHQDGRMVAQGSLKRTPPLAGAVSRLTLELKRS